MDWATIVDGMVIVVMGAAGSGKSTVGTALAADLGWIFVEGDDHHPVANLKLMQAGRPLADADRAPWLRALHEIIAGAINRRDLLRGDLRPIRFVYLHADRALLSARLEGRAHHFAGAALLDTQLADLEPPDQHTAFTLDAAKGPVILVAMIRRELGV
jgi:gluconokinase